MRLGATLCQPHNCQHCGGVVDEFALHGLSCRKSRGRHPHHAAINMLLQRALASARVPSHLEPPGILRADGRRPDGASDTFAPSHVALAAREACAVAFKAEQQNNRKYSHLCTTHYFSSFAVETSGVFGPEALSLVSDIGRLIRAETGEPKSKQLLLQVALLWQYNEGMQHRSGVLHM